MVPPSTQSSARGPESDGGPARTREGSDSAGLARTREGSNSAGLARTREGSDSAGLVEGSESAGYVFSNGSSVLQVPCHFLVLRCFHRALVGHD